MTKDKEQTGGKTYQCEECGLWYKDKEISEKCQAWCKEHKSCNLEIIKHSIKNMTNNNSQKGFAMPVIIAIVAVVLVLGGVVYYANQSRIQEDKMAQEKAMMEKEAMEQKEKDAMMEKKDREMMKKEDGAMMAKYTGTVLAGKSAPLLDYNKADYDAAIASDKLVVLYFYANWCPICKEEVANALYPAFNGLTTDKVVGIRINYKDSDTDKDEENLARQYGISYQHTKVFLKNGKQILKAPDAWDKSRYLSEINKALAQ